MASIARIRWSGADCGVVDGVRRGEEVNLSRTADSVLRAFAMRREERRRDAPWAIRLLRIPTTELTPYGAVEWAWLHGYHYGKALVTRGYTQLPQASAEQFVRGKVRTIDLGRGIEAIYGKRR